jgi:hypothetical protein
VEHVPCVAGITLRCLSARTQVLERPPRHAPNRAAPILGQLTKDQLSPGVYQYTRLRLDEIGGFTLWNPIVELEPPLSEAAPLTTV